MDDILFWKWQSISYIIQLLAKLTYDENQQIEVYMWQVEQLIEIPTTQIKNGENEKGAYRKTMLPK